MKRLPNCPHHIIAQGFDKGFKVTMNGFLWKLILHTCLYKFALLRTNF